jgi:hypothetical protein
MKYSVLLPTRNGGPYLENCIRSILDQGYTDLELIISDNANTDTTPEVISKFANDPRVTVLRLEAPISVTDNWNNALFSAKGEYVLMMGDDDYLLPGYFTKMDSILERHGKPDCVLHNAYSYVAPNSIASNVESLYSRSHFQFGADLEQELVMSEQHRFSIVRDMFRFKVRIPLNMQTTLVSKAVLPQFFPPFPDHYALNSLLLTAKKWVFTPEKLLVVGVSPKSFGHYFYSSEQKQGLSYLGISPDFPGMLPGSELTNGMHMWLNRLKEQFPNQLRAVEVDRGGYVRRQAFFWYMQKKLGFATTGAFFQRLGILSLRDWIGLASTFFDAASWGRLARMFSFSKRSTAEIHWNSLRPLPGVRDIAQFSEWLTSQTKSGKEA